MDIFFELWTIVNWGSAQSVAFPLLAAAENGHVKAVLLLVEAKADIEARNEVWIACR